MNARGIPTAAYQVPICCSISGGGGGTYLGGREGGVGTLEDPRPDLARGRGGVPTLAEW